MRTIPFFVVFALLAGCSDGSSSTGAGESTPETSSVTSEPAPVTPEPIVENVDKGADPDSHFVFVLFTCGRAVSITLDEKPTPSEIDQLTDEYSDCSQYD